MFTEYPVLTAGAFAKRTLAPDTMIITRDKG